MKISYESMIKTLFISAVVMICLPMCNPPEKGPVKIGILHSFSGTMAVSEKPVVEGTMLAIDEINEKGGIDGRMILPVVADGKSDPEVFRTEAERLITEEKVSVVFGCWTSASRKTVLPVFEKYNNLLFYPVQYEGLEQSPNIVYTGSAPNQQIIPAIKWCFDNLGEKFFLVGSDYIFPHAANEIIREQSTLLGAKIVGEKYVRLGSGDMADVVHDILQSKPDVIINTINGSSNTAFFRSLGDAGILPGKLPVMSFSICAEEICRTKDCEGKIPGRLAAGNYVAWNYFQSIESEENRIFVERFRKKHGADRVISDPAEAAYFGVYMWAQAVKQAGTLDVNEVLKAIAMQSFPAPEGMVFFDAETNHCWKTVRIGKIDSLGDFKVVWTSGYSIRPIPYPATKAKSEWREFLSDLYQTWGEKWENAE